ncbi:hypothetical protein BH09SUM1_BH09SUM1_11060 [soil metagenome]
MKSSIAITAAATAAIILMSGCGSSSKSDPIHEMKRKESEGQYTAAYDASKAIVDNKANYTESQLTDAMKVQQEARPKLIQYYISMVNSALIGENPQEGVGIYEDKVSEFPEIAQSNELSRKLMRAYVQKGKLDEARLAANAVMQNAPSDAQRYDAEEFLKKLDKLADAESDISRLMPSVQVMAASTGIAFDKMESGLTCGADEFEKVLNADSKKKLYTFLDAMRTRSQLTAELGKIG